jgi:acetolactate synthase-1/2/3 large subunit
VIAKGLSGAQALLRVLAAMGVERIFASPGSDWAPLWEALAARTAPGEVPQYLSSRHEETAVAMAVGYAKATGKLPVVVLHTTVGALHAAMIVRQALHERIAMVVLAGESVSFSEPPAPALGRQWLRLLSDVGGPARLMEPCAKWSFGLNSSQLLPHTVQRACQLAMSAPKGPVFVSLPSEFLMETMNAEPPAVAALPRAASADPRAIDELAQTLCAAANPMIVTEEAGREPAAVDALVVLAEALGAPVLEAWAPFYVNFPRLHPLYGGVLADEMPETVRDADVLLLVEAVAPWYPPSKVSGKKVLVLGEDPLHSRLPYWGFRADLVLAGGVAASLRALGERVKQMLAARPGERWRERHERERLARRREAQALGDKPAIDTRWVAHELNEVLPARAIVVNETITHRLHLQRLLDRLQPGGFYEADYGGLGVGLGLALGVKHAQPDRTVVCTIGDGAFNYNPVLASFGAAQEHGLPILVVLFNNSGYLSQKTDVVTHYPQGAAVRTGKFVGTSIAPAPDYAALARAFGGYGEKVESPREVRAALGRGLEAVSKGQLALVDLALAPVNPA